MLNDVQILIPMAGEGSRFAACGYVLPKPMIDVGGSPMIVRALEDLPRDWLRNCVFLANSDHLRGGLRSVLDRYDGSRIVEVDVVTQGAAATTLLAKDILDRDKPLLIMNCDQIVKCDYAEFISAMANADAGLLTFHPDLTKDAEKWSYVRLVDGLVVEVAEKKIISDVATAGVYFWRKAGDYIDAAESMIAKDLRVRGEFYVCPVFNETIGSGKSVVAFNVNEMICLGTPEDLENYLGRDCG